MTKFNGFDIIKLEKPTQSFSGVYSYSLERTPEAIQNLEPGYYSIDGKEFKVKKGEFMQEFMIPLRTSNIIVDYMDAIRDREWQEELGKILSEIIEFELDMKNELIWNNYEAKMKSYYFKEITIKKNLEEYEDYDNEIPYIHELFLDGRYTIDIYYHEEDKTYTCYDGWNIYGRGSKTIKEVVKRFMDDKYRYPGDEEEYEVSCSACGDGGCPHCEPWRFI